MGCWSKGKTLVLQTGNRGSIPRRSTDGKWKVAGYGWPGHGANVILRKGMRVRLPHLPLDASVVKWKSFLASNEKVQVRLLAEGFFGFGTEIERSRFRRLAVQDISVTRRRLVIRFHPGPLKVVEGHTDWRRDSLGKRVCRKALRVRLPLLPHSILDCGFLISDLKFQIGNPKSAMQR